MSDNTAGQAERGLWTDERIETELRRIGDNMRLYIADAATVAEQVRDEYEQALAAAQERIAELEAQLAERGEWEPVQRGDLTEFLEQGALVEADESTLCVYRNGEGARVALPENIRLCRRVQREDEKVREQRAATVQGEYAPVRYSTFVEDQSYNDTYLLITLDGSQLEIGRDPTSDGVTVNLPSDMRLCRWQEGEGNDTAK